MDDNAYEKLAQALDKLPNGFTRTKSGVEIRILKKIFSPEDAALACQLGREYESSEAILKRVGGAADEVLPRLLRMVEQGLLWSSYVNKQSCVRLAPFVVGIYENMTGRMDHELAHLMEDYYREAFMSGALNISPSIHRVVPAQKALGTDWILPYDDVRAIILKSKSFHVNKCICKVQRELDGHPCKFPVDVCLGFSNREPDPHEKGLTQEQALEVLNRCEELGLVHTVANVCEGVYYVCNCCNCCCPFITGVKNGLKEVVARSNYFAHIDPAFCADCGTCRERCPMEAIEEKDGYSAVDESRCIGCGLCVSGCPNDVAHLERKPDYETIHPPANFEVWEHARLAARGLE